MERMYEDIFIQSTEIRRCSEGYTAGELKLK